MMRWDLKDVLGATTLVALVLMARLIAGDNPHLQWRFVFSAYFSLVVAASVLAWVVPRKWKPFLLTYSILCGLYGVYFLPKSANAGECLDEGTVGFLFGVASAIAVGLVCRRIK
jgi:hypothetical protein